MKRPLLITALMAMSLLLWQQSAIAQTTHYVDNVRTCAGLTPCYATIMEAVSAAVPFDCIEVFPGVYREAVVLDDTKNNVALRAHIAALKPVIEAPPDQFTAVFLLGGTSGVQVLNFAIETGISTGFVNDVLIQGNVIRTGIRVFGDSVQVIHNTIQGAGITIEGGSGCVIARNTVIDGSIQLPTIGVLRDCVIRHNVVRNGGIFLGVSALSNTVEFNVVDGGSIEFGSTGANPSRDNVVRRNVVRRAPGNGITLFGRGPNTIEANFVSGSAGDGILVQTPEGEPSIIRDNTSVENAGCDINDETPPERFAGPNVWQGNRFGTQCGAATD